MTEKRQILKSASIITLATVISRICGYLRDQRITLLLGTSVAADSFVLAFRIPNLFRRLVGEGSLSAAFIPLFTSYLKEKPSEEAWSFAGRVFWILVLILTGLTCLGVVFSPQVIHLSTLFGGSSERWNLAVYLNRLIFPYLFFIGLSALAMAILNSLHLFGLAASMPILFNLSIITFSLSLIYRPIMNWVPMAYRTPAIALAVGILVGGALQMGVLLWDLARRGMQFRFAVSLRDPGVRALGALMVPGFLGIGIYQINFFVDLTFATASRMPQGSLMSLYVADRVMELVLGTFAIAMSTAILPLMSHQAVARKFEDMKKTFGFSLRFVSFITIPAMVGLILLRQPIVQVLFQHGRFAADSTTLTCRALLYYSLGLPALAAVKLVVPLFYSIRDTQTPMVVAVGALILNIALNLLFLYVFFRVLSNGSPALATSLAAYFNFSILFALFRKRFGRLGTRGLIRSLAKITACSSAMGLCCAAMIRLVQLDSLAHFAWQLGALAGMIAAAIGVYLGVAWLFRCEELGEAFGVLRGAEVPSAQPSLGVGV